MEPRQCVKGPLSVSFQEEASQRLQRDRLAAENAKRRKGTLGQLLGDEAGFFPNQRLMDIVVFG